MSFWTTSTGAVATGTESDSGAPLFLQIPNNTHAIAKIVSFKEVSFNDSDAFYQVTWRLLTTSYANILVKQKIDINSQWPEKRDRAVNMLYRLFKLCDIRPENPSAAPTAQDLKKFEGKELGIIVLEWQMADESTGEVKSGNWVSMVKEIKDFASKDGHFLAPLIAPPKPLSASMLDDDDEDLPF